MSSCRKEETMKGKKSTITTIIVMLLLAAGIIWMFVRVNKKENEDKVEAVHEETELEKLLSKDLKQEYPPTAREVIKFYSRILCQIYKGEELQEEELEGLAEQLRELYSEELLAQNTKESHLEELKKEIEQYSLTNRKVLGYQVEKANSAIHWTAEEKEFQRLIAVYSILENKNNISVYEEFLLCLEDSKWKIMGWKKVDGAEMDFY